jgi:hypothetical protein
MKIRLLMVVAVALFAFPAGAHAKGATEARIEGAGLRVPLRIGGDGEPGSNSRLTRLAEETGFFPAVFGQEPNPLLAERPPSDLGPRYTVTYTMPGPNGDARIRQEVYPYATPTPLAYTPSGQPYWDGRSTRGGWFAAPAGLKSTLFAASLPATAPTGSSDGFAGWDTAAWLAVDAAVLLFLAGASIAVRRRPQPVAAR